MTDRRSRCPDALRLASLFAFAFSQPLLDLLGRHPAFFVCRGSRPIDLWTFVLGLSVVLPGLFAGLLVFLPWRSRLTTLAVGLLGAVILLPLVARWPGLNGWGAVLGSLLAGSTLAWCHVRYRVTRLFTLTLSPAVIVFPVLFLCQPGIREVAWPRTVTVTGPQTDSTTPVVMVVFDEFPLSSLLDGRHQIDDIRYPHFAKLARESHWFRNATTVHAYTTQAVPALLTGNRVTNARLPTLADHPRNLFTLLAGSHEMHVQEACTSLCPEPFDTLRSTPSLTRRLSSLATDLALIEAHLLLPGDWTRTLPSIHTNWKHFANQREWFHDRPRQFEEFLARLQPSSDRPGFWFLHHVLPHAPFSFLPSGQGYGHEPRFAGLDLTGRWLDDEPLIDHTYQRHLLQVGYVDRLLGRLIARLEEQGLYDRCLLVVTADHGISFRPGTSYRAISEVNHPDILRVPLFVKRPGQRQGVVSDRNVQHVDLVPTIASVLGMSLPWQTEGRSALGSDAEPDTKVLLDQSGQAWTFGKTLDDRWGCLDRRLALFGSGPWDRLYRRGPFAHLVGRSLSGQELARSGAVVCEILHPEAYAEVQPDSLFVPAQVQGVARLVGGRARTVDLAIAVNGTIEAMTRVALRPGAEAYWAAMVPTRCLRPGANVIEAFEIEAADVPRLARTSRGGATAVAYHLSGNALIASDGRRIPLERKAMAGYLDAFRVDGSCVSFAGWAADLRRACRAETIVILADGKCVHCGRPNTERPDVAQSLENERYRPAGFTFNLPRSRLGKRAQIRLFALSREGKASELRYDEGYRRAGMRPLER